MMTRRLHTIRASIDTASIRTATFNGDSHLVIPIVALVGDIVVRPLGSTAPEFVPAEELAAAPQGWNNRPVLPDHPTNAEGQPISANHPEVLEALQFGQLFNTEYAEGRLRTEVWVNAARAQEVGPDAVSAIGAAQAAQTDDGPLVEVSVGAFVSLEEAPDGADYAVIWRDIVPDHLAFGLAGGVGACSVEAGCGGPRVNRTDPEPPTDPTRANSNRNGTPIGELTDPDTLLTPVGRSPMSLRTAEADTPDANSIRFGRLGRRLYRFLQDTTGTSDSDLRQALTNALMGEVPAFDWIHEVYPDTSTVVYSTWLPDEGETMYQRTFTAEGEGDMIEVGLNDDAEEVKRVTRYEVATADGTDPSTPTDTDDTDTDIDTEGASPPPNPATAAADSSAGDDCSCNRQEDTTTMSNVKDLAGALIQCERAPFSEANREQLEAMTEETLTSLRDTYAQSADPPAAGDETPAAQPAPAAPSADPPTEDEETATVEISADELTDLRAAAGAYKRQRAGIKSDLVQRLVAASTPFSEVELKAKTVEELTKIAALAGLEVAPSSPTTYLAPLSIPADDRDYGDEPPDSYALALARERGGDEAAEAN